MHPHWLTICFTMPPGNGNGSRSVPPGQWTFLFSVLLLLLLRFPLPASRPPSFVTPSGSTDALASDTNRYLFVGPSACLSTSCISLSLSSSVQRFSNRAKDATLVPSSSKSSFLPSEISLVNELSDILHVSWFTTIPVNRFAIRGDDVKFSFV